MGTVEQGMDFVKEAIDIQKCDDLDNVDIPTCKVSNSQPISKEMIKFACTSQGVDAFKAGLKEQQAELEKKLKEDKDPSSAFGVKPLTLVAPLLALYLVL